MRNDPNDPYFHRPPQPGPVGSNGFAGGPPVAPLPPLPTGPPPPAPKRGWMPWAMAGVGLVLVAGIIGGAIALWGGPERGTLERGGGGTTQADPSPTPESQAGAEYSTPQKPCSLIDTDKLADKYGRQVGQPTDLVREEDSEATGRYGFTGCSVMFTKDGKTTRVMLVVNVMHDGDKESPADKGKTIQESVRGRYLAAMTKGCDTTDDFAGDWEEGVSGSGTGCHASGGREAGNVVVADGNMVLFAQVTTSGDGGSVANDSKDIATDAVEAARRANTT